MQRYFVNRNEVKDDELTISGEDAHHISRVMRASIGDEILCCVDKETYLCTLTDITKEYVIASIVQTVDEVVELPHHVTIAQGMPKGDKLDFVIQKGTELGAAQFQPFYSSRTIVKWKQEKAVKRVERLNKIAKEAAEQSHRKAIPTVFNPITFEHLLQASENFQLKIVAYEEEARNNEKDELKRVLHSLTGEESILFVVGPEGGFSADEIEAFKENDFSICGLGPRILRTETASLYMLAALSYETELKR